MRRLPWILPALLLGACAAVPPGPGAAPPLEELRRQVEQAERSFARSMAERDHAAFTAHLSEQAVFYGPRFTRGKAEVAAAWKPFFEGPQAPFSWAPDRVDVLADGTLAHSSGPVHDPSGKLVSRFNSVWRQEAPGVWRIVFDKGEPLSEAARKAAAGTP